VPIKNYPGVQIQELNSAVHSITSVPTAVTAFVGRAVRGPVNRACRVHSFQDFTRIFGGFWDQSELSYIVEQFFTNGGSDAYIVRGITAGTVAAFAASPPSVDIPGASTPLRIAPLSPGGWFQRVTVTVNHDTRFLNGIRLGDEFNLSIAYSETDPLTGTAEEISEVFRNVSVSGTSPNFVQSVLANNSHLFRVLEPVPIARPGITPQPLTWDTGGVGATDDGTALADSDITNPVLEATGQGIYALKDAEIFNLLLLAGYGPNEAGAPVPPDLPSSIWTNALTFCKRHRAMLIMDPPSNWSAGSQVVGADVEAQRDPNAMLYFPRLRFQDLLYENGARFFQPSGAIAGVIARSDIIKGVWKAAAGGDARITGVLGIQFLLNERQARDANSLGLNSIRSVPESGAVTWGARTLWGRTHRIRNGSTFRCAAPLSSSKRAFIGERSGRHSSPMMNGSGRNCA